MLSYEQNHSIMELTSTYRNNYTKTVYQHEQNIFHLLNSQNSNHSITFEAYLEHEFRPESAVELNWSCQLFYLGNTYIDFTAVFRYDVSEKEIPLTTKRAEDLIKESFEQFVFSLNDHVKEISKKDFYLSDEALGEYADKLKNLVNT